MAPEVLRSERFDERADVYSYGVVLWECLTGQCPWESYHPMQVLPPVRISAYHALQTAR